MIVHIHADDMGATDHSTRQLLASWQRGFLTSFSVLANGTACDQLADALAATSHAARIACHLNLSEGPSSAPGQEVQLLVDEHGNLSHTFLSLIKAWLTNQRGIAEQVETEWRAQIQAVQRCVRPRPVDAVDGHMHVHMLPFLFPIAAKLASEYRVPSIRISLEPFFFVHSKDLLTKFFALNFIKHVILRMCSWRAVPVARRHGLAWPKRMVGILYAGRMTMEAALAGITTARRGDIEEVEVLFHLGRALKSERQRWARSDFIAEFYCSPHRDEEKAEAAKLANYLTGKDFPVAYRRRRPPQV